MSMYEKELVELSEKGARYLVIGGIALGLHGYLRATADLDILPDLEAENLDIIIKVLQKMSYAPRVPVDPEELKDPAKRQYWYTEKNMRMFTFINPKTHDSIDLMIYHPLDFDECFKRRRIFNIGNVEVSVVSLNDMIELKKISLRPQDKTDIEFLERMLEKEKS